SHRTKVTSQKNPSSSAIGVHQASGQLSAHEAEAAVSSQSTISAADFARLSTKPGFLAIDEGERMMSMIPEAVRMGLQMPQLTGNDEVEFREAVKTFFRANVGYVASRQTKERYQRKKIRVV